VVLELGRLKHVDHEGLLSWHLATTGLLEPAGLVSVGDLLSLPPQDLDLDLLTNNDSMGKRARHLRDLALPTGLVVSLTHIRAGYYDETLRRLASLRAQRARVVPAEGEN